ncbi:MAG: GGDEF domain-containing protein [Candidatus Omnitrophica bacterium]|nr:GGDEF domain-containing protein [Candidatus Omnitrophota bacterium]
MSNNNIEQILGVLKELKGLILLWVGLFLVCIVLIITLGVSSYRETYRSKTESIIEQKRSLSILVAGIVSGKLDSWENLSIALATRPRLIDSITDGNWPGAIDTLKDVSQSFPFIDRVVLYDPNGIIKADEPAATPSVIGQSRVEKEWFKGITKNWKPYVSGIYQRGASPKINVISIAIPIQIRDSFKKEGAKVIGILQLQVKLDAFQEWIKEANVGRGGLVFIVDQYGHIVYHPKFRSESQIVDFSSVPIVRELMKGLSGARINYNPVEKEKRVAAYRALPKYKWGVVVTQPMKLAFAKRDKELLGLLYGYLAYALLFFILIGLIFHALIVRKISEDKLKVLNEELQVLSLTDPLTGVCNRRGFEVYAHQFLRMAARDNHNGYVLFIDIDNMKWINDNLGHSEGDAVLKEVAEILKNCFRTVDIIARLGGDEFSVLISTAKVGDEKIVIQRLEEQVARRNEACRPPRHPFFLSIGGVACNTHELCDLDKLLSEADKMMYVNKSIKKKQA